MTISIIHSIGFQAIRSMRLTSSTWEAIASCQKSLLKVFKYKYSYRYLHCILTFLALALLSPPFFNKFKYRDDNSLETTVSTLSSHCHLSAMLGPLTSIISHCNNRWRIQWRHGCILHQRVSTSRCTPFGRYHSVRIHQRCTQKYTESSPRWHSVWCIQDANGCFKCWVSKRTEGDHFTND